MDIVLSYNNMAEVLTLPVVPSDFSLLFNPRQNEEFDIIGSSGNIGKLNIPGLRGLKVLSIVSFFPNKHYPFAKSKIMGGQCINMINKWANSRNPIRIIVTHNGFEMLNMACLIENFEYGIDRAGDNSYTLELKEFVLPVVK